MNRLYKLRVQSSMNEFRTFVWSLRLRMEAMLKSMGNCSRRGPFQKGDRLSLGRSSMNIFCRFFADHAVMLPLPFPWCESMCQGSEVARDFIAPPTHSRSQNRYNSYTA